LKKEADPLSFMGSKAEGLSSRPERRQTTEMEGTGQGFRGGQGFGGGSGGGVGCHPHKRGPLTDQEKRELGS